MKRMFCFILAVSFLSACGGLYLDDDAERRDDDREGEVPLPKEVGEKSFFDKFFDCDPKYSSPDNVPDIAFDMFDLNEYNYFSKPRTCAKEKLDYAYNRLCGAREQLERRREQARDDITRSRIEDSIHTLDKIHFRFNQHLYEWAVEVDNRAVIKLDEKERNTKDWKKRIFYWWGREETEAYRDILDIESYRECNSYSGDEDNY